MKGIAVIVCCYNSALRLPQTIRHLTKQKVSSDISWEIIIVNNASKDNTPDVAFGEWGKNKVNGVAFKVVDQPIAGLSHAREKGIETCSYDYLIFCDDDNWLSDNYVETAFNLLEEWPTAAIIGGIGLANPEKEPQYWFTNYSSYYATGPQNKTNGLFKRSESYVYGAGSAMRKNVLQKLTQINFKPLATDRRNESLSSGGDVELCYAAGLLGYKIGYSDNLKFQHFIPANRLTDTYLFNLVYQFGYCNILHRPYYWLFNHDLIAFKKTWWWTLLISSNIYGISLIKYIAAKGEKQKFKTKLNLKHATGRLAAAISINLKMSSHYSVLKQQFKVNT